MSDKKQAVMVDGHRIVLTNLDKVLYPETGTTKADVLSYYASIAGVLIPHATDRPATRKRWVHGVGTPESPGEAFFQKNLDASAPSWVKRRTIEHKDHVNEYPVVNDLATLTWLAQLAAIELHVPQWKFGRDGNPRNPDRLVLDLDPGDGATLAECAEVAKYARVLLTGMGLDPVPVTSGSKGIHLYAALDGKQTSDQVSDVAHELARILESDHPDLVVSDMKKAVRGGKVFVDWSQNNAAKTTVAPYSLRGKFRPLVAVPRTWREIGSKDLAQLDYEQVLERMTRRKDPMAGLSDGHLRAIGAGGNGQDSGADDRLTHYRSKRNAARTPEPIPAATAQQSDGQTFVIQEHRARRLHHDLRFERDGVLVSWALPKGVPTEPQKNHLAVQTEDHPLEYGRFEGRIPDGEYGAGVVTIWDAGEYELEKWRDGEEVIATLYGEPGGGLGAPKKIALIHTGGEGKAAQNWLIHLMKDSPSEAGKAGSSGSVDRRDTTTAHHPKPLAPMLASLGTEADITEEDDWAFEMKWDGIRAVVHLGTEERDIRLLSRNGNDITVSYPEIVGAIRRAAGTGSAVLDGEIVAVDMKGRPNFGLLQTRMKLTKTADVEQAMRRAPVQLLLFDILEQGGRSLVKDDYDSRRRALEDLVHGSGPVQVPPAFEGELGEAMRTSATLALEGVVAKKRDSTYSIGRRSRAWVKLKHHRTQEVVIGGWRPGKGRRAGSVGSLLVGIPGTDGLRYAGRVGTGFADRDLDDITATLSRIPRKTSPFVDVPREDAADAHWVSPKLVGEVEFAEWTPTMRLRHPSWRGWRPDKSASDVVEEG
jgi:bifunctional non-homologous end joining protein LigD